MLATLNSISSPLESPLPEARIEDDAGIIGERLGSAGEDLVVPAREWTDAASRGLIVVVAIVLAWYTWARWGDFQVDCGRELYVPIEILRGKLLYRDLFYPYGPLAPYTCALLIGLFGPQLVAYYLFGIAIAIGCAVLLFDLG